MKQNKYLISRVFLYYFGNQLPLLGGRIHSRRVVSHSVQNEGAVLRGSFQVSKQAIDVEGHSLQKPKYLQSS